MNTTASRPERTRRLLSVATGRYPLSYEGYVEVAKLDTVAIQKRVRPPKGENWGSLKSLERLLETQVGADRARAVMGPLFGVYELCLADAHLPANELDEALEKVGVDKTAPYVVQGYQLLQACVDTIDAIIHIVAAWKDRS